MKDNYNLQRFVDVQADNYDDAVDILRRGAMCTPSMGFIFPHLAREYRGDSYGLGSLDEARAYLHFQPIGNRYREYVDTLFKLVQNSAHDVFGDADAQRLHASLTVFAEASNEVLLRSVLIVWFGAIVDEDTIVRLNQQA